MSAPVVDEFDLDVRIGEPLPVESLPVAAKTSDFETCFESHCATCGSACCHRTTFSCL